MNNKCLAILVLIALVSLPVLAQRPRYDKLSPMLRKMVRSENMARESHGSSRVNGQRSTVNGQWSMVNGTPEVCAFVQVAAGGEAFLEESGCRVLAQEGDICIANIPKSSIGRLSLDDRILRIEANRSTRIQTDSLAWYLNTLPVYEGRLLPQAFTGQGVVVGVMDIGFDLTHPSFYSNDTTDYRIRRFWDMLSADTVGSQLPVGRDFTTRDELLAVAHARDGLHQTHGTHTLGIAAGSGYDSPYRGMAPESDICIVANAVTEDTIYIDPKDYDKYTFALDALGFKYIFDYAQSVGKPCVINFSEGSMQDFWGYDQLYYEMLRRISGPGRIIVSAAGNYAGQKNWFRKPMGEYAAGTFLRFYTHDGLVTLKGDHDFTLRLVAYESNERDTLLLSTSDIVMQEDSVFYGHLKTSSDSLQVTIEAYPSCYNPSEICCDIMFNSTHNVGSKPVISLEVMGKDADVEAYRMGGYFYEHNFNPDLCAGDNTHSVLSPATAPCVICVGATYYRLGIINYLGEWRQSGNGHFGEWAAYSSIGPTMDGRIKPDVLAPGSNIISSYSSFYLENHPDASDIGWDVKHFDFNGRTYAWNSNSGTSMSSPAVAGAIALWLQAKPDLTMEDVLDVFSHTCREYDQSLAYPNNYYGYGEIDVYRGLLYLLGIDKITDVSSTQSLSRIGYSDGRLTIDCGTSLSSNARVRLFSLTGRQVYEARIPAGQQTYGLVLPRLAEGVYAVQIDGPEEVRGSQLLRIAP